MRTGGSAGMVRLTRFSAKGRDMKPTYVKMYGNGWHLVKWDEGGVVTTQCGVKRLRGKLFFRHDEPDAGQYCFNCRQSKARKESHESKHLQGNVGDARSRGR